MPAFMPSVSELSLSGLLPHLVRDESGWTATWRALTLHSVFQPVLSVTHQCVVGYEALLRAFDPGGLLSFAGLLYLVGHGDLGAAMHEGVGYVSFDDWLMLTWSFG